MRAIDDFFLARQEPVKSCLQALRDFVLRYDHQMTEHWKYKMPCYYFKERMFCYLWIDKKRNWPYILMVDGRLIDHPALEAGNRARMKVLIVDPEKDLPVKIMTAIFRKAIKLH
jgi:hypothetical protein